MKYVHLLLSLTMLGFAAVQYNDPDVPLWVAYYCVPACFAWMAAFRPATLRMPAVQPWLMACVLAWLGLVVFYWPSMPNFWVKEVWMAEQSAREGMGLMIAWVVLVLAFASSRRAPARLPGSAAADATAR